MSHANTASSFTRDANAAVLGQLAFGDTRDFDDIERGLIASLRDGGLVRNAAGEVVFDLGWFSFIGDDEASPDTVNPSLWRQSQLVTHAGLFRVTDRIYQVRNHDLANVTIVEVTAPWWSSTPAR
jgi:alkyl sulfatase BDS1-like metallo-beta-lactamase superfamily hydrolase